ncbi:MAG: hypothetical protein KGS72_06520 [Cyanobacteria bacterium REEB67]|nr:hypothetical protein [Cyanobacteria bacterium REEB67]
MANDRWLAFLDFCRGGLLSLVLLVALEMPALALQESTAEPSVPSESEIKDKIAALDQKIMLHVIELARFNLHYHGGVNQKNFSQEWLYPMQREAGTALNFTNTVIDIGERARGFSNLARISESAQRSAVTCALTGQAITGTSSAVELLQNLRQTVIANRRGYSPSRSVAEVQAIDHTIADLLDKRKQLMAKVPFGDEDRLYSLQGRLLEHLRNQLIFEFKNWSVSSRSQEWSENTFYALDSAQGYLQMSASCLVLKGFRVSGTGGNAAILNLVANGIVVFNPLFKHEAGRLIAARQRKHLDKIFPLGRPQNIDSVLAEYDYTPEAKTAGGVEAVGEEKELAFLIRESAALDGPLDREVETVLRLRRIADQQAISGPLIGLSGVTRSLMNTIAYYQISRRLSESARHSKLVANRLNLAGRIVQSTGQTYSLYDTASTEVRHYRFKRALQKAGNLPKQRLQRRLDALDKSEKRIKASQLEGW